MNRLIIQKNEAVFHFQQFDIHLARIQNDAPISSMASLDEWSARLSNALQIENDIEMWFARV